MLFLIGKFLVATINDSPCFVKIAIFSHRKKPPDVGGFFLY